MIYVFKHGIYFRNLRTGSILCSYGIKEIDDVFQGPYLTFTDENDKREWVTTENQPFTVG